VLEDKNVLKTKLFPSSGFTTLETGSVKEDASVETDVTTKN
jgi:hypothetical protein